MRTPGGRAGTPLAGRAALWLALIGACLFAYVLFVATSKPDASGLMRFSEGPLHALEVLSDAPPQPPHEFSGANGEPVRLSDFRGQVLVVNFWATWCAPCREEMPSLAALATAFAGQPVHVAAITLDSEPDLPAARAMLTDLGGGALAFYADPSRAVALDVGRVMLPTTVIYDGDGVERARLVGDADWSSPEANALITAVLADQ